VSASSDTLTPTLGSVSQWGFTCVLPVLSRSANIRKGEDAGEILFLFGDYVNYYPFHIGDYASHTRGLSLMEDLAYRRLLDEYYLHEHPLNDCSTTVARQIGMIDHAAAVDYILTTFFERTDAGYINTRADDEIRKFQSKQQAASKAGRTSAERRFNDRSTTVQRPSTNQNQEPEPSSSTKKKSSALSKPVDVSEAVWGSFLTVRKAKKAAVTDLAILGIRREAVAAGITLEQALTVCCERGWAGFKADWYSRDQQPQFANPADAARTTVPGSKERDPALVKIEQDRERAAPPPAEVKAKMAELLGRMKA